MPIAAIGLAGLALGGVSLYEQTQAASDATSAATQASAVSSATAAQAAGIITQSSQQAYDYNQQAIDNLNRSGALSAKAEMTQASALTSASGVSADISAAQDQYNINQVIFNSQLQDIYHQQATAEYQASQASSALQQQQSQLTANRALVETARQRNLARSTALATATASGSQGGSGLAGGYGQISSQAGRSILETQQDLSLSDQQFLINNALNTALYGYSTDIYNINKVNSQSQVDYYNSLTSLEKTYYDYMGSYYGAGALQAQATGYQTLAQALSAQGSATTALGSAQAQAISGVGSATAQGISAIGSAQAGFTSTVGAGIGSIGSTLMNNAGTIGKEITQFTTPTSYNPYLSSTSTAGYQSLYQNPYIYTGTIY